ncbi:MAG: aminodeoxychorismate/anthranilate synthase component II [Clostridia bacterium]|nr:aminodeoxychorismate/anthranilate synthase component II [Clostridia bacterium]
MVLLIDNYDSFSYNVYQLIGGIEPDIKVVRNDALTTQEIRELSPSHIILSPGPGRPSDAGICIDVVKELSEDFPILGICLGHQAICEAFGGTVSYAKKLYHGKASEITVKDDVLFSGLPKTFKAARYHSLALVKETLPEELEITAETDDGEVMAVRHKSRNVFGLQFHPESILTEHGEEIIRHFLQI